MSEPRGTFDRITVAAIVLNAILLAASLIIDGYEHLFEMGHNAILIFFVFEILMRMRDTGWRPRTFLASRWNAFDSAVIALSLLPMLGVGASLLRLARLARIIHLMRHVSHVSHLRLADLVLLRCSAPTLPGQPRSSAGETPERAITLVDCCTHVNCRAQQRIAAGAARARPTPHPTAGGSPPR